MSNGKVNSSTNITCMSYMQQHLEKNESGGQVKVWREVANLKEYVRGKSMQLSPMSYQLLTCFFIIPYGISWTKVYFISSLVGRSEDRVCLDTPFYSGFSCESHICAAGLDWSIKYS